MTDINEKNAATFPLAKLLPNLVTIIGLCIGLSAIRFALEGDFVRATSFLLLAGFLDGIDGRLARFLHSTSEFGAQLFFGSGIYVFGGFIVGCFIV